MRLIRPFVLLSVLAAAPSFAAAPAPAEAVAAAAALLAKEDAKAGPAVAALRASHPDDPAVDVLQVRWLLQTGEREDALDLAEDVADAAPRSAQAQYWLGNAYGQRIGEVGMLTQARYAPKLREAFERALALDPTIHEARLALVQFHLQAPSIVGGDPAVAKAQQRELARRDPPRGHFALAQIAESEQDEALAVREYIAAWKARPDNKSFRMAAGLAMQSAGRWDDAHALFAAWTKEDRGYAPAWYQLGRLAAISGKHLEDGSAGLRKYLAMKPERGQPEPKHAWYRLGQVQAHAGDVAAARASLQQALKLDPDMEEAEAELAKL